MSGKGRRAAMVLAKGRPPKSIKKPREVTAKSGCHEELTALMACWSVNSFDESKCQAVTDAFQIVLAESPAVVAGTRGGITNSLPKNSADCMAPHDLHSPARSALNAH
eukprot:CAMPEP_0182926690 /NCGR_PEP_ID=MMETSP0105_2-20130417/12212_1 /TAXON_ID=81532 ORGANISM="Acanthoeca-like sp., Strain 10tr" /NCGR_SAMPLE_ID=MMETSP0105_2 /ASSEMBLY_ACC=CAM_ASM_000205 /LENGTH=107 /DNA_ID=CAMNT_0025064591 /DNA_START=300 /DNA_END=624 /DNA_ORIENTATION=+